MAVVTRRRGIRVGVVVAAAFPLLLAGGAALLTVVIGGTCSGTGGGDAPSRVAVRDIPGSFLRIYEQVGARFRLPWEVLVFDRIVLDFELRSVNPMRNAVLGAKSSTRFSVRRAPSRS